MKHNDFHWVGAAFHITLLLQKHDPQSKAIQMKKVLLLVDVQNVYYTTRQAYQRHLNYNKLWAKSTENRQVVKAIAYAIDRGDPKQQEFQNILRAIGFEVKLKPFIQRADGSAKGDWDVGITIDAMEYAADVDIVVLVSGDGDFDVLVKKLSGDKEKWVEVYGVPELTSVTLMQAASQYFPIDAELLMS